MTFISYSFNLKENLDRIDIAEEVKEYVLDYVDDLKEAVKSMILYELDIDHISDGELRDHIEAAKDSICEQLDSEKY